MAHPENQDTQRMPFTADEFLAQDDPDDPLFPLDDGGDDPWKPIMEEWARLATRAYLRAKASELAEAASEDAPAEARPTLSRAD